MPWLGGKIFVELMFSKVEVGLRIIWCGELGGVIPRGFGRIVGWEMLLFVCGFHGFTRFLFIKGY
jgi:hypothetical protein